MNSLPPVINGIGDRHDEVMWEPPNGALLRGATINASEPGRTQDEPDHTERESPAVWDAK